MADVTPAIVAVERAALESLYAAPCRRNTESIVVVPLGARDVA